MDYTELIIKMERAGREAHENDQFDRFTIEQMIYEYAKQHEITGGGLIELAVICTLAYTGEYIHERGHYSLAEELVTDL